MNAEGKITGDDGADTFSNDCDVLEGVSYHLGLLADAFRRTGNHAIAEELDEYASDLYSSLSRIKEHDRHIAHERFLDAQQASVNLYRGVMAGIRFGAKSDGGGEW